MCADYCSFSPLETSVGRGPRLLNAREDREDAHIRTNRPGFWRNVPWAHGNTPVHNPPAMPRGHLSNPLAASVLTHPMREQVG